MYRSLYIIEQSHFIANSAYRGGAIEDNHPQRNHTPAYVSIISQCSFHENVAEIEGMHVMCHHFDTLMTGGAIRGENVYLSISSHFEGNT
jgi:hypothetical protein